MVKSWDCFDTLVTRRKFDPLTVFMDMEQKLGLPNFVMTRKYAEGRAPWTLDTIYDELALDYGWTEEEKEKIKQIEIETELEHCCPIMENIRQVTDGDLIVSDMYLSAEVIKRILVNCGLKANVQVYVTTAGKAHGTVWPTLPPIALHTGDNIHSDVHSPQHFGISAVHYQGMNFTSHEQIIGGELALLIRLIRLGSPYEPNSMLDLMWKEQASLNIPSLILASLELPSSGLAFVMRDCIHLKPIHEIIHGKKDNVEFHCSRLALKHGGEEYKQYILNTAYGRKIIDIQGSGGNLLKYWNENFKEDPDLLYITGSLIKGSSLVPFASCIERFNSSPLGSLIDYPNRLECEFDLEVLKCQADAVALAIKYLPYFKIESNNKLLQWLISLMPESYTTRVNNHVDQWWLFH